MKQICLLFLSISFISLLNACCKDDNTDDGITPFVDAALFDEWTLDHYEDSLGNTIKAKPINIPDDIELIFRTDSIISGHVSSFDIDGNYSVDELGNMTISLEFPNAPTCCEWDDYFLERYATITNYSFEGESLVLFYGNEKNRMVYTNEKIAPFFDPNLINLWTLWRHENIEGTIIHEKPEDTTDDIILIFGQNNLVSGQLLSFSIDGFYNISSDDQIELSIGIPDLPICCIWDDHFLEAYSSITTYEVNSVFLKLYYDNGNKVMVFYN